MKTWKGRQERGQFDVHKRRIRAKGEVFRNRCWKQGNLSTVSSRGTVMVLRPPPIVDLHLDVMQTLSEGGGHRTATTEALAAPQRTQAVCLLFSPELFIPSICVTLPLRNAMVEMGE